MAHPRGRARTRLLSRLVPSRPVSILIARALGVQRRDSAQRCYFGDYRFSEDLDFTLATDLTGDSKIRVYALDEIAVEKVAALTDRARNEPRDLYDLWYLTSGNHVDLSMLLHQIDSKFQFRGRGRDAIGEELRKKEVRYEKLWSTRLGSQMAEIPPFDDVFRSVRRNLRAAGLVER